MNLNETYKVMISREGIPVGVGSTESGNITIEMTPTLKASTLTKLLKR